MKNLLLILALCIFIGSCANELSDESKKRENSQREFDRLSKAAGHYLGYISRADGNIVPAGIDLAVQKNPTDAGERPTLLAALRVGLFGGVIVSSTSANFDWGKSEIVVSFGKKGGGNPSHPNDPNNAQPATGASATGQNAPLEFRATVSNDTLLNPILVGANSGTLNLVLGKNNPSLFTEGANDAALSFFLANEGANFNPAPDGAVSLTQREEGEPAPDTSDLPLLPGLDASLSFEGLAKVPEPSLDTLYDPLRGTLELHFTRDSYVEISGLFLKANQPLSGEFFGRVILGGSHPNRVKVIILSQTPTLKSLPSHNYLGTYQGNPNALKYKLVGYLDYEGTQGVNPAQFPFPYFPNLRLELVVCIGNQEFQRSTLQLDTLDHISHHAHYKTLSRDYPLGVNMTSDWSKWEGTYEKVETGQQYPGKIWLNAMPDIGFKGCEEKWSPSF